MNSETITILITSAGGVAGQNCIDALRKQSELTCWIIAVDANPLAAGLYKADKHFVVPLISDENYLDSILLICEQESVDVILPTYSKEIGIFSTNIQMFAEKSVKMCITNIQTVSVFESKWLTYEFFQKNSIETIPTWKIDNVPNSMDYPLYIKPDKGSGSINNFKVESKDDLLFHTSQLNGDYVVQKFMDGQEVTIDVLANKQSQVLVAIARERLRVQSGLATIARTCSIDSYINLVQKVVKKSEIVGPINIQGFSKHNNFFITDVNIRFAAGGLPLTIFAGANIPLMTVKLALGKNVLPVDSYQTGLVMLRYYTEFFIRDNGEGYVLQ